MRCYEKFPSLTKKVYMYIGSGPTPIESSLRPWSKIRNC